jgi:polyisoprenoid-binding protein YceI
MGSRTMIAGVVLACAAGAAGAAEQRYTLDPAHTYPSFEADHLGISTWRGKFTRSRGHVTWDRDAQLGSVDVEVESASIAFGHAEMDAHAHGADYFDVARHPLARYAGRFAAFRDGLPTRIEGTLTLRGVSRPLTLAVRSLRCVPHPLNQRELCGADLYGVLQRDAFGIDAGKDYGFDMNVVLRIQAEALRDEDPAPP